VCGRHRFKALAALVAAFAFMPAVASAAAKFGSRALSVGMRGNDVKLLQRDLTASGFDTTASGDFTLSTKNAVLEFQRQYKLSADGVAGSATFKKLFAVLRAAASQPDTTATASSVNTATTTTAGGGAALAPTAVTSTTSTTTTTSTTPKTQTLPAADSGGAAFVPPPADGPVEPLSINGEGLGDTSAISAPEVIQEIVAAANNIAFTPYIYGGGHASFISNGYDCSGSVSYALHGGGLIKTPIDSTQFESYGQPGPGRWITLYANAGHVYMEIGGVFYDTAAQSAANGNDRWSTTRISPSAGFVVRHPTGW
jgi:peptidoglycan hydrolase-like protein with peptidoglycan-binding domain